MTVAFFHVRPRHLFFEVVQEWNILHQYFGRCAAFVRERLLSHDCCLILDYRWVWIPVTRTSIQVMKTTDWDWRVTARLVFVKYWSSGGSDTLTTCNNPVQPSQFIIQWKPGNNTLQRKYWTVFLRRRVLALRMLQDSLKTASLEHHFFHPVNLPVIVFLVVFDVVIKKECHRFAAGFV